jgi:hypothetical protein
MTPLMLANSKIFRQIESRATNPNYSFTASNEQFSLGEVAAPAIVFGNILTGTVNRTLVKFFFGKYLVEQIYRIILCYIFFQFLILYHRKRASSIHARMGSPSRARHSRADHSHDKGHCRGRGSHHHRHTSYDFSSIAAWSPRSARRLSLALEMSKFLPRL